MAVNARYYSQYDTFIESTERFLSSEIAPHLTSWENADYFPDEVFPLLGKHGYLGLLVPEEYGGMGSDYKLAAAWCEVFGELPAVGFTTGVNMHSLVISHALSKYGTKEAKDKWLAKSVTGDAIGAYAFTEPSAGSDLAQIRTRAVRHGSKWKISGAKTFITNGARADYILVLTRNDVAAGYKGFTTFVVDTSLPGFSVQRKLDKLGWRSSDTAELVFDEVEVDDSCILGKVGDGWVQAAKNLNWERIMLSLTSLGGAKACYASTLKYAEDRHAFGAPLTKFGSIATMLKTMVARIDLGEALLHHALDLHCDGKDPRLEVAMAKRLLCEDAVWIADRAIQIHGGYGYTKEFLPERWWRDLRLMTIGGGTSEIMANIAAKSLNLS